MRGTIPLKYQSFSLNKRTYVLSAIISLLPITLLCLYFFNFSFTPIIPHDFPRHSTTNITNPPPPYTAEMKNADEKNQCDYSNGRWVSDKTGPLYNSNGSTTFHCKLTPEQNCFSNGKPDLSYLYWRWEPSQCHLPRFDPLTFLQIVKNKHVAFIGDSLARNQFESLTCMLSTVSTPNSVYHHKDIRGRWYFRSHNATLSLYWSRFLVEGVMSWRDWRRYYHTMYLDLVDQNWAGEIGGMDLVVISLGHWFEAPAVYYEGGSVFGCHKCHGDLNCTDIGFYGPLRKALRIALNSIIEVKAGKGDRGVDVIVRTYSPDHFEGEWDKGGGCNRTSPYGEGEVRLEGIGAEIRRIQIEEVEIAKGKAKEFGRGLIRIEAMDVTKLALLRPDGHAGAYTHPFPFEKGVPKYVQSDCIHWCLPGPIDTWNDIFVQMLKDWEEHAK